MKLSLNMVLFIQRKKEKERVVSMKSIVFAGGCFWGVQAYLKQIEGVKFTEVGYANGKTISPSYEDVSNGSGHAEAVAVCFDSNILTTRRLINLFFEIIDPTSINKQGNDVGIQYRTGIFSQTNAQEALIIAEVEKLSVKIKKDVNIEITPLRNFYRAEDYHQNYLDKNPNGYCHIPKSMLNKEIPAEV